MNEMGQYDFRVYSSGGHEKKRMWDEQNMGGLDARMSWILGEGWGIRGL